MAKGNTSVYFDRGKNQFVGLEEDTIIHLKKLHAGIDVDLELSKMQLWLTSPKGRKRKGHLGFILNWLRNAEPAIIVNEQQDTPLRPEINEYLEGLWESCRHVLEFNTVKR